MLLARWSVDARFGHRQEVIGWMQGWLEAIGGPAGLNRGTSRILVGAIGACESTVQGEFLVNDLAELEAIWKNMAANPAHQDWGRHLEPLIVSGSNRWEILHVL
jgi:hypothetical protein